MSDVNQSTEQPMVGDDYEESDNNMQQSNDNMQESNEIKTQTNFDDVVAASMTKFVCCYSIS